MDHTDPHEALEVHNKCEQAERNQKAVPLLLFGFALSRPFVVPHPQETCHHGIERNADQGDGQIDGEVIKALQSDGGKRKIAGAVVILTRKKNDVVDKGMKRRNRQIVERRRQCHESESWQVGPESGHEGAQSVVHATHVYSNRYNTDVDANQRYPGIISKQSSHPGKNAGGKYATC
jgi:hypothetical protein